MTAALDKARAKSAAMRAAGEAPEHLDPAERARRNPRSRSLAIKAKCYDCQGAGQDAGWRGRIASCEIPTCALWPHRPYQPTGDGGSQDSGDEGQG